MARKAPENGLKVHMRRGFSLRSAVVMFVVLVGLSVVFQSLASSESSETPRDGRKTDDPVSTPDALIPAQGAVGIQVRNTEAGAPAFGPEEVRDYFASTDPPYWDSTAPRPQIENIEFLSALEVESRLGRSIDRPEGSRMCLVTIRGQFVPPLPPGVQAQGRPAPDTVMQLVFDGQTGNLLVFGFPPPER